MIYKYSALITIFVWLLTPYVLPAQRVVGQVTSEREPVPFASVGLMNTRFGVQCDSAGFFSLTGVPSGRYTLEASMAGFKRFRKQIVVNGDASQTFNMELERNGNLEEVVVTGTMREVSKLDSPVPVDLIPQKFLYKNPTPSIFEGLSFVNGVRPQVNCNVCNTGDIHINGLEGPYTMVLMDGMPIVSGLSTVYGLIGIPNSLIDRVEIVKGPASTLYGSEAVGGLINIITRSPSKSPRFSADVFTSNWLDTNVDLGMKFNVSKKVTSLVGVNYFNYQNPVDQNGDGFTDLTLQHRVSIFNRWAFQRRGNKNAAVAVRFFNEDRWGGQMNWNSSYRGGDVLYGESIYTRRWEVLGNYDLPGTENITLQYSLNSHHQNSYYGTIPYMADQKIAFAQFLWEKAVGKHNFLTGVPFRYTFYNDNTPATQAEGGGDQPEHTLLPGLFVQDEIRLSKSTVLLGARVDHHSKHGYILTPRAAYRYKINAFDVVRFNVGRGFRVVNLFTEDHAALTGARKVIIKNALKPEQSWNANLNWVKKISLHNAFLNLDASVFYTWFNNRIIPDYDSNPNQIIYDNLKGYAVSRGVSLNADLSLMVPFRFSGGVTLMDNFQKENGIKVRPVLTEKVMGTWSASYEFSKSGITIDYTGNVVGPMRLPVLGEADPRPRNSPWWSIQNIQVVKSFSDRLEVYGGVKNLLNFRPDPHSIARSFDPFDKDVQFDADGNVVPTANNPYALTFDPSYVYAPNQGLRAFLGLRLTLK